MNCNARSLLTFGSQVVFLIYRAYQVKSLLALSMWEAFANICRNGNDWRHIHRKTHTVQATSVPISVIKPEAPENVSFFSLQTKY